MDQPLTGSVGGKTSTRYNRYVNAETEGERYLYP